MIVDERMVTYIHSLERPENPVIEAIEQEGWLLSCRSSGRKSRAF